MQTSAQPNAGSAPPAKQHHNSVKHRSGNVSAVCRCCGGNSASAAPDGSGEPDLWKLGRGWSCAPFSAEFIHSDGSAGSTFTCPTCNRQLKAGHTLYTRAGATRLVQA